MAIKIKSLYKGPLSGTQEDLYPVPVGKDAIIKSIRLVNTGTTAAVVDLYVRRGSGDAYRIAPKGLTIGPNSMYVDDNELTLEGDATALGSSDRVQGILNSGAASGAVECVISGVERDQ